ncbi:MAG: beta-hydroxyacyl-ACP dehydratase, partial [Gemmatimonadaceae bacterium]|nr:beta-hydroxyacyl-ACP dehydratase [Acetobacteraceae bacterium]
MDAIGEFDIPHDHPCLPGHFPGRPIVPGVVLLDAAFALILAGHPGQRVTGLPSIKFTHPVRPGDTV